MPISLIVEIIQAIMALAPEIPEVISLGESVVGIVQTGSVTPEQEAAIRAQLDAVKAQIDASSP
jgi:hypothetical protein